MCTISKDWFLNDENILWKAVILSVADKGTILLYWQISEVNILKSFSCWQKIMFDTSCCLLFVCVEILRPSQPNGVMSSMVSLPNHMFTGQASSSKRFTSTVHSLLPETDNCPSWISRRERTTVENISWSISMKEWLNPRPLGLQSDGASNWATMLSFAGLSSSVGCTSDWRLGGRRFDPHGGRQHSFVVIDHEIFSMIILSLLLIQEGQLSVSDERMCTMLVNCLLSFWHHSERCFFLGILFQMKIFCSEWRYLIRNHLSFLFLCFVLKYVP